MAAGEIHVNPYKPLNLYTKSTLATISYTHLKCRNTVMELTLEQSINKLLIDMFPELAP